MIALGVMLRELGHRSNTEKVRASIGKVIRKLTIADDCLSFRFDDDTSLHPRDMGQSCCESRYMTCEDDLSRFIGGRLLDLTLSDAPTQDGDLDSQHDIQFLHVATSNGTFSVSNHNEHNGYYGGFSLEAS